MKKILIVSHGMEIGGAERSLLGLLYNIDYNYYEIDLFLYRHTGELLSQIPEKVNLLPEDKKTAMLAIPIKEVMKARNFDMAYGRFIGKLKAVTYSKTHQLSGDNQVEIEYSYKYTKKYIKPINPKITYDLAISFLTPHYIVTEKVRAKKKIAWIHTDYSNIDIDVASEYNMWNAYDNIVSISDECTKGFLSVFPNLSDKIIKIEHMLPCDMIWNQAVIQDGIEKFQKKLINICSVGRFCKAKNFDNVPDICKRIQEQGIDVRWYLIGSGTEEELIRKKIQQYHMEEYVLLLGKKENPYPYIAQCDIYVQPSRYEGKAVTVREAQILNKPVVITSYTTASSQLEDGFDGIIVPMDNQGCADSIVTLIKDKKLQEQFIENTKKTDYSNAKEIQKLYSLMGDYR